MLAGFAKLDGNSVLVINKRKEITSKIELQKLWHDETRGYRKTIRLMELADRFNIPIISFIDTPGAYPGVVKKEAR